MHDQAILSALPGCPAISYAEAIKEAAVSSSRSVAVALSHLISQATSSSSAAQGGGGGQRDESLITDKGVAQCSSVSLLAGVPGWPGSLSHEPGARRHAGTHDGICTTGADELIVHVYQRNPALKHIPLLHARLLSASPRPGHAQARTSPPRTLRRPLNARSGIPGASHLTQP